MATGRATRQGRSNPCSCKPYGLLFGLYRKLLPEFVSFPFCDFYLLKCFRREWFERRVRLGNTRLYPPNGEIFAEQLMEPLFRFVILL